MDRLYTLFVSATPYFFTHWHLWAAPEKVHLCFWCWAASWKQEQESAALKKKGALSGSASDMAESPPVLCQTKVQWHAFDPPHWQIAWNTFLVFFAVSAWQLLNLRWGATVHCFFVCVLLFFLVLEVTSGLPPSMSVSVGRRNYASLTLFLTLCLSISLLFNGCLSALMHVCHMRPIA